MYSQPTTASSDALTVFHFFPKLPIEARIMIWEFALPRESAFQRKTTYP
jgi:hypothetical protein